jgi:hypothetical protein
MGSRICAAVFVILLAGSLTAQQAQPPGAGQPPPASQPPAGVPSLAAAAQPSPDPGAALLAELQDSARAGDYAAFGAALDRARRQKDAGGISGALPVYEDLNRLWTFGRTNRLGAFLTEGTAPEMLTLLRRYDGFEAAMRPLTIRAGGGVVVYPAAEARAFLIERARDAARGIRPVMSSPHPSQRPTEQAETPPSATPLHGESTSRRKPAPAAPATAPSAARAEPAASVTAPVARPQSVPPPAPAASAGKETPRPEAAGEPVRGSAAPRTAASTAPPAAPAGEAAQPDSEAGESARLILFVVLAIVAVGALVLIFRTTRREPVPSLSDEPIAPPRESEQAPPAEPETKDAAVPYDDGHAGDDPQQIFPIQGGRRRRRKR